MDVDQAAQGDQAARQLPSRIVLVAADGSPASQAAVRRAKQLVTGSVRWIVANVTAPPVDPNAGTTGFAGPVIDEDDAEELDRQHLVEADGAVARTARALGDTPVDYEVLQGDAGPALCDYAAAIGADLIVAGTHHHRKLLDGVMGSVSTHLSRHAPCPVLLVRDE